MNKSPKVIMTDLHKKFDDNFTEWDTVEHSELERTFIFLKGIAAVGELLRKNNTSKHHEICCEIYDEIFSDGATALYLASISMDKPARIVLRRILELGVAALYLWDMPHMAHSWNSYDHDLSFTEMLNHINSEGYSAYVNFENSKSIEEDLIPGKRIQKIYGDLSDIVHGKIATFESSTPDRFKFVEHDWLEFVNSIEEILETLLKSFITRYDFKSEILSHVPQINKELDL